MSQSEPSQSHVHTSPISCRFCHTLVWVEESKMRLGSCHWCCRGGLLMFMPSKDVPEKVMIFDVDVHFFAKIGGLDYPPVVFCLQLMKEYRGDWARRFHHEVT